MTAARRPEGYTLDDLESLEPRGRRIELVNGRFVANAAPAMKHQRIADRLQTILDAAVAPEGMEALTAIGVRVHRTLGVTGISDVKTLASAVLALLAILAFSQIKSRKLTQQINGARSGAVAVRGEPRGT